MNDIHFNIGYVMVNLNNVFNYIEIRAYLRKLEHGQRNLNDKRIDRQTNTIFKHLLTIMESLKKND